MPKNQSVEWKSNWQDDNLKALCGFANAQGGCLVLGRDDDGTPIGLSDTRKLLEDLPQKIPQYLGISSAINLVSYHGHHLIEIRIKTSTVPVFLKYTIPGKPQSRLQK